MIAVRTVLQFRQTVLYDNKNFYSVVSGHSFLQCGCFYSNLLCGHSYCAVTFTHLLCGRQSLLDELQYGHSYSVVTF